VLAGGIEEVTDPQGAEIVRHASHDAADEPDFVPEQATAGRAYTVHSWDSSPAPCGDHLIHSCCEDAIQARSLMAVSAKAVRSAQVLRVKPLRRWFGLSQEEFARVLGVGRATVVRWEAAAGGPLAHTAEGRFGACPGRDQVACHQGIRPPR